MGDARTLGSTGGLWDGKRRRVHRLLVWALVVALGLTLLGTAWAQTGPAPGSEQCPSGPAASFTPSSPGAAGTFLLFSDVHFNPFAAPALVAALVAAPVEGWHAILAKGPAGFSPYGQDTNNALFQSFLDAMVAASTKPDFILFPGDLLCHHFWALYPKLSGDTSQAGLEAFIQKTVEYFYAEVSRRFPGVPVYTALGNNDSTEGDYRIQPGSPYLAATAQTLARMLPTEASRADFLSTYPHYGCYAVTLPEAGGVRLAPSISPVTGNNPGFQVYTYDREGPAILDETTYFLDLAAPAKGWRQEYVYSATYGRGLRGPADWQATYRDLGTCPPRRLAYGTNYDLGSAHVDDVTETTFPTYWRAMAAPTKSVWEAWSAPVELVR